MSKEEIRRASERRIARALAMWPDSERNLREGLSSWEMFELVRRISARNGRPIESMEELLDRTHDMTEAEVEAALVRFNESPIRAAVDRWPDVEHIARQGLSAREAGEVLRRVSTRH